MNTRSQHLIQDIWITDSNEFECKINKLKDYVKDNFSVVETVNHIFNPYGETFVNILSESHFCFHTYPEHNYISIDLYICNMDIDLDKVSKEMLEIFKDIKLEKTQIIQRGFYD